MEDKVIEFNRHKIDSIDRRIVELLAQRLKCAENIGAAKKQQGLPINDQKREEAIISRLSRQSDLNPDFIEKLYKIIFQESKKRQK